jgi:hypothetical protein
MLKFATVSSFANATPGLGNRLSLPRLDFSAIGAVIEKMKPGYQDKLDRQKLAEVFQLNNEVREVPTGRVFTVFDLKLGVAFLIDSRDNVKMVDWHTSAGHLKGYIADDWELVKAARPAAESSVDTHIASNA